MARGRARREALRDDVYREQLAAVGPGQKRFLERYTARPVAANRSATLVGWDWTERPEWAVKRGIVGVDTDMALLADLGVDGVRNGVRFDEVVGPARKGPVAPVFHRPLFRHLGLVTNRTFETFYADTLPVLMLPRAGLGVLGLRPWPWCRARISSPT